MGQFRMKITFRLLLAMFSIVLSINVYGQQMAVSGHVIDETGEPVIGATVRIIGTNTATVTNIDGEFTLSVEQGASIAVSYVGYKEAVVPASPEMTIKLEQNLQVEKPEQTGTVRRRWLGHF